MDPGRPSGRPGADDAHWQRHARGYLLAEVQRLERLSRHAPPGDSTARRCAAQILAWLDFGDSADARVRLAAIVGDIQLL